MLRHRAILPVMTTAPGLLTTRQVAERLGVDPRTVHRMADDGRLAYVAKLEGATGAYVFDPAVVDDAAREWKRQEADSMTTEQSAQDPTLAAVEAERERDEADPWATATAAPRTGGTYSR
jgi:excisionase family DNA binding protein